MEEIVLGGLKKRQKNEMSVYGKYDSNSNSTIPWDLLTTEILTRLPTKSLIRFKTVCKQWLSTISSPEFAKLQLERSNDMNHHSNNNGVLIATSAALLPSTTTTTTTKQACGFLTYDYNIDNDHTLKIRFEHRIPPHPDVAYTYMGSCNGLVCFWLLDNLSCLWNPITRERRIIPNPPRNHGDHKLYPYKGLWGLGYIRASDDYKLVHINYHPLGGRFFVSVYTLRSNKWNQYMSYSPLADSNFKTFFKPPQPLFGININNVISHWVVNTKGITNGYFKPSVLAFDMVNESFNDVPLPSQLKNNPCEIKLGENPYCLSKIKDNLCIISHYEPFSRKAWELKCYGDWGSWTKIFEVDVRDSFPSIHISDMDPFPLNISKEGFQLFLMYWINSNVWLIYKSNDKGHKCLHLEGLYPSHQVCSHVESLVSPFVGKN